MPADGTEQRKLAAIMFTDMVGYSALTQRNEALALELLHDHRRVLREFFPRFDGREVETTGDGFLVEFASALEATRCAVAIQKTVADRNAAAASEHRFHVRIGIHVGDVVHREGKVMGDAVNIAARVEPLAQPGGVCVTRAVWEQIHNKLEQGLVRIGATKLKNIQLPIEVFRVAIPRKTIEPVTPDPASAGSNPTGAANLVATESSRLAAGASRRARPQRGASTSTKSAAARITSLAVKPLDDFSGDASQAYLSDGMTEALCAALGNISALRVPGRSSVMRYKGAQKSIPEMARELDVDAIVEGSVQRAGNRMLITVQLIEAATDRHIWATNYERDLSDFFKVQSEVALAIAEEVQVRLTPEDQARLARARTANPEAIEVCLMGMHHWWQWSDEGATNALRYFRRAIEIDPNYAPGHAGAALYYAFASIHLRRPLEAIPQAKAAAKRAIELDPMLDQGYVAMGKARLYFDWDWTGAENDFRRALTLSPNSSLALNEYQAFLLARGRFSEAIVVQEKALEHEPLSPALHSELGATYYYSGQPERAIPHLRKALELDQDFLQAHVYLGWCHQFTGRPVEAMNEFQIAVQSAPDMPWPQSALGYAFGAMGRRAEAMAILVNLDQIASRRYVSSTAQAFVCLGLGQTDAAIDWLEKGYEERDSQMIYLKVSPALARLRGEPRFQALLNKVGIDK